MHCSGGGNTEIPTTLSVNKSSRTFWILVLAQACAVVWAMGSLSGSQPSSYARVMATRIDITNGLKTILDTFSNDCHRYPKTVEGLKALTICPSNILQKLWKGPYLDPGTVDPWGHDFVYRCPGIHNKNSYDLYSTGPDGISKTGGNDPDDINSWDPKSPHAGRTGDDAIDLVAFALLLIPFVCAVCSIATIFSPGRREFFSRNRAAHFVWIMISLIAFMAAFLIPRLAG